MAYTMGRVKRSRRSLQLRQGLEPNLDPSQNAAERSRSPADRRVCWGQSFSTRRDGHQPKCDVYKILVAVNRSAPASDKRTRSRSARNTAVCRTPLSDHILQRASYLGGTVIRVQFPTGRPSVIYVRVACDPGAAELNSRTAVDPCRLSFRTRPAPSHGCLIDTRII